MKITIGVFAHVDAGKTTFCECLLYQTNCVSTFGRVDHGNAVMDHDALEKRRGITIFSDIASFSHEGQDYCLIDTPGHIDFSAEMERALSVLDAAILLISAADGVQSHTITVCRLLREKGIPIYIFINKTDQDGVNIPACMDDIHTKLHINSLLINDVRELNSDHFIQWLCDYDDELMHHYLDNKTDLAFVLKCAKSQIRSGGIALAIPGSALHQKGVMELLDVIGKTLALDTEIEAEFAARVFKVIHDPKGAKITLLKCLSGSLTVRNEVSYGDDLQEKITKMRLYQGKTYTNINTCYPGDIVGVAGLTMALPGMGLGKCSDIPAPVLRPALKAAVLLNDNSYDTVMECLRKLEAQDPLLEVTYEPSIQEVNVCIMGKVQLEVLKDIILERFGIHIDFSDCHVVYKETVAKPVMGYGHFEPLRHYAETHLRLEPNPNGGIAFTSELHVDRLGRQYQNLIRHSIMERDHKGILTGSSLTDIRFVLTNGAVHDKHTHGGDLREATWRAVRQGMEKAASVLLEPYYEFLIDVDTAAVGRVLSDITKLHGTFTPPEAAGERTRITGSGPVEKFLNYQAALLSFTKGTGAISLSFSGYFPCHNPSEVIERIGYQKDRDMEHTSSSVFCAKGAGFEIKWDEAEAWMHLER
ncbi:MAG: TetM/TetW/TetO/TetS family tetracycline resistance ribosomal protection protein [Defluviitaleaceae bacterium]|nr:TetM/TetW/TetO/TetS family tetracycline resistance ribosomal protection protein [Defluviitaleaceae bacterium]